MQKLLTLKLLQATITTYYPKLFQYVIFTDEQEIMRQIIITQNAKISNFKEKLMSENVTFAEYVSEEEDNNFEICGN